MDNFSLSNFGPKMNFIVSFFQAIWGRALKAWKSGTRAFHQLWRTIFSMMAPRFLIDFCFCQWRCSSISWIHETWPVILWGNPQHKVLRAGQGLELKQLNSSANGNDLSRNLGEGGLHTILSFFFFFAWWLPMHISEQWSAYVDRQPLNNHRQTPEMDRKSQIKVNIGQTQTTHRPGMQTDTDNEQTTRVEYQ